MAKYQFISASHWDEAEYLTETHQNVAAYIIAARDMAGVVGIERSRLSKRVRIRVDKLNRTLDYFEQIGKLQYSKNRVQIWWKSGIWHSLNRGKYTPNQLRAVQKLLKKWNFASVFVPFGAHTWAESVVNHYQNKYGIDLQLDVIQQPNPNGMGLVKPRLFSDTNTKADTDTDTNRHTAIRSAYFKKFGKNLPGEDCETLLLKYGNPDLLKFMIENITLNNEIDNPVGLLITARDAPGSHLPDSKYEHDYDEWKRMIRQVASRS